MIETVVVGLIVTVAGGLIVAGVLWIRGRLPATWRRGVARSGAMWQEAAKDNEASQLVVLREQVREVAREQGLSIADYASGRNPTIVTFTDGHKSIHFSDHAAYQRALRSRRADPLRSKISKPPQTISAWNEEALRDWLAEHAT